MQCTQSWPVVLPAIRAVLCGVVCVCSQQKNRHKVRAVAVHSTSQCWCWSHRIAPNTMRMETTNGVHTANSVVCKQHVKVQSSAEKQCEMRMRANVANSVMLLTKQRTVQGPPHAAGLVAMPSAHKHLQPVQLPPVP